MKGIEIYSIFLKSFIIILIIINIVLVIFLKNYQFIFVSLYIFQIAEEEVKKDKIRKQINNLLNVEI